MVVDDLDVEGISGTPAEADPPLLIHADAVLPLTITFELLQPVSGRNAQITQDRRSVEHPEFPKRNTLDPRPEPPHGFAPKQALGVPVLEALDHIE
jgi:hypothetical protein